MPASVPNPTEVLPRLTKFEVLREIGRGGAGIVYAAVERETGRRVALKTLRTMDGELLLQLKSEFRALQDLDHPNLIRLEHLMREDDTWFMTMELVTGVAISAYVTGAGESPASTDRSGESQKAPVSGHAVAARFDEARLRDAFAQLASGLAALHAVGKVHRDIKPANVLVTIDGRVVILDLGLVRDAAAASEDAVMGTALYMAPEQVAGDAVDPAVDSYAVGVLLYLCLTGAHPFDGDMTDVMNRKMAEDPPPPSDIARSPIPPDLEALCVELLRRDPAARPSSTEIVRRLRRATPSKRPGVPSLPGQRPFVGRGPQFERLGEAFSEVLAKRTAAALVTGESGVGKSALVRRFTRTLASFYGNVLVLSGRCYEHEHLPYKALDGIIDAVTDHLASLPDDVAAALLSSDAGLLGQVFPVLQRVIESVVTRASTPSAALGMQEGRARFFAAMRELFAKLADRGPLVLVIDDIQWADDDSLALLSSMLRPPDAPPLLLLATARTERGETTTFGLPGDVTTIPIERLTRDDGVRLATALLEAAGITDSNLAQSIASEADGHPLFLDELVRQASQRGTQAARLISLDDVLTARIRGLDPGPRRLLEVVALAGIGLPTSAAMAASGTSVREYGAFARALRAGHLARTTTRGGGEEMIETYHDRVRAAVVAQLPDDARRRDHQAIARALETAGGSEIDPEAIAHQWLAAGDEARALVHLLKAAEKASKALAFDRAARIYERAIELMAPDAPERQAARLRLAECFAHAGRGVEAARAFAEVAAHAPTPEALEFRRQQAEQLLNAGRFEDGEAVMNEVLGAVGLRLPKSTFAAIASFLTSRARLWLRGLASKERNEAEIPRAELTRLDACAGVAALLGMFESQRSIGLQTKALLIALDAGEPQRLSRALAVDAAFLSTPGQRANPKWQAALARAAEIAERLGTVRARGYVLAAEGLVGHMIGDWAQAQAKSTLALELLAQPSPDSVWDVRTVQMVRLWAFTWTGQFRELQRELGAFLRSADARGDLYAATCMAAGPAGGVAWLCGDDPAFARRTVRAAAERWTHRRYSNQQYWSFFAESHADLYEGRGLAVRQRILEHWPKMKRALIFEVQIIRIEALFFRARTAIVSAAEEPSRAAEMLREAARIARAIRREDAPYAAAMAELLDASLDVTLDGTGRRTSEAIARLRTALERFDARGMQSYREAARWRLGQLLGGDEGRALVETAEAWARGEDVKNPARMLALMAPGFAPIRPAAARLQSGGARPGG